VRLIERRIGFLFAVFLTLLALGAGRAAWLGVVKAGTLKQAAVTQQEADITVPARRGTIVDREGTELAVSQPAVTIAATPTGVRNVNSCLSGISDGTVWPYSRRPSPTKKSHVSTISCTSPSDSA
jgi:cell division protein FtsI/penicillin-binding protein 2